MDGQKQHQHSKDLEEPNNQWIGLRENLQENPHDLNRKITLVSCKFSLKPIH